MAQVLKILTFRGGLGPPTWGYKCTQNPGIDKIWLTPLRGWVGVINSQHIAFHCQVLPFRLQPLHVLWVPLRADCHVFEVLSRPRKFPRRVLENCWEHIQVPAPAHVPRGTYLQHLLIIMFDFSPGAKPSVWIHKGLGCGGSTAGFQIEHCNEVISLWRNFQVTGRNIWIFALIDSEPRMQTKPVVFYLFMTYAIIEIFRYFVNTLL